MADSFSPNFNLTLPEVGASFDTWGTKLNANLSTIDKHLVPVGAVMMWSGAVASIPNNWALCDGANGTPDLRGMFIVGAGSTGAAYAPADTGGANSVTLSKAQMPAHGHSGSSATAGAHNHGGATATGGGHSHVGSTGSAGSHNHGGATGANGGHSHTASSGAAGGHTHTASSGAAGEHSHTYARYSSQTNTGGGNDVTRWSSVSSQQTSVEPNHTHPITINSVGGHSHSVTVSSVANHAHGINSDGAHAHSVSITSGGEHDHGISTGGAHTHTVTVENTGGGESHENRPPYYALAFIMHTG